MAYRYNHKTGNFDYDDDDAESSYNYDNSYDDSDDYDDSYNDLSDYDNLYDDSYDYDNSYEDEEPEPYFGDNVYDYSINKYLYNKRKRGEYATYRRKTEEELDDTNTISIGKVLTSLLDKIF